MQGGWGRGRGVRADAVHPVVCASCTCSVEAAVTTVVRTTLVGVQESLCRQHQRCSIESGISFLCNLPVLCEMGLRCSTACVPIASRRVALMDLVCLCDMS